MVIGAHEQDEESIFGEIPGESGEFADRWKRSYTAGLGFTPNLEWEDRWILDALERCVCDVTSNFSSWRINDAAGRLYDFFWHDYCDWYLELAKPFFYGDHGEEARKETAVTAGVVLETFLRLLHPIMPFLTEEIWQRMPGSGESIMISPYPGVHMEDRDIDAEEAMDLVVDFITAIRNLRTELGIPPASRVRATLICKDPDIAAAVEKSSDQISRLADWLLSNSLRQEVRERTHQLPKYGGRKC